MRIPLLLVSLLLLVPSCKDSCVDADGDGICDGQEACPPPNADADGDGVCDSVDRCPAGDDTDDFDADGVPDACDPCPIDPGQSVDADGDGVCDGEDQCPGFNDSSDYDQDGVADGCDPCPLDAPDDSDDDGVCDTDDRCPGMDDLQDTDGDGVPDGCDPCPVDSPDDSDGDGTCDTDDLCPGEDDDADFDGDSVPDACDVCPVDASNDSDGDGSCDSDDLCPGFDDLLDADGDSVPDDCDPCPVDSPDDSDGDGVCDSNDLCPGGFDGFDIDADGVPDACDLCPFDALDDSDGDGVCDSQDLCPGYDDGTDSDGDTTPDGCDVCPLDTPNDTDGDGVCDSDDPCPLDWPNDTDLDGVCDSDDPCPIDNPDDSDGDGVCDSNDPCPFDNPDDANGDGICDSNIAVGPSIAWVTPAQGLVGGGYIVELAGTDFLPGIRVEFGEAIGGWADALNVQILNGGTLLRVMVPPHAAGPVDLRVTNTDSRQAIAVAAFEYLAPVGLPGLTYTMVSPTRGPVSGGYRVLISGSGFVAGVGVEWGDPLSGFWLPSPTVDVLGPTLIEVVMPNYGSVGIVSLRITNPIFPTPEQIVAQDVFEYGQAVVLEGTGLRFPSDLLHSDRAAVVFDANNDGLNDVLVINGTNSGDQFYLNTVDLDGAPGLFVDQSAANLPTTTGYTTRRLPAARDVDNDGDVDVLFVYGSNLGLYSNRGDGTFDLLGRGAFGLSNAEAMVFGDLNCDGVEDLFVARNGNSTNLILLGDGAGNYTDGSAALPAHAETSRGAALGDVDNDGDVDIVVANDNAVQNRLYYNNCANMGAGGTWAFANATYGAGANFPISGFNSRDVLLEDLNNDGWLDAVVVNNGQDPRFYANAGGSFLDDAGTVFPQFEPNPWGMKGAVSDFDNDGDLDLMVSKRVASSSNYVWPELYLSDLAQGGLGAFTNVTATQVPSWRTEDSVDLPVGDLDGDGVEDIFVLNLSHQDWILINNGYAENVPAIAANRLGFGTFANNTILGYPEDADDAYTAELGDMDGDGDLDIVLGYYKKTVNSRIWVNDGRANFYDESWVRLPGLECESRGIDIVDLNNDGDMDLVYACYNQGVKQLSNDGNGVFTDRTLDNVPSGIFSHRAMSVAHGDFDMDGDQDLLVGGNNASSSSYLVSFGDSYHNDGALLVRRNDLIVFPGATAYDIEVADMNGDGVPDAFIGNSSQNTLFHADSGGTGLLVNVTSTHVPAISDSTQGLVVHDFDLDGDQDAMTFNTGANRLLVGDPNGVLSDQTASNMPATATASHRAGAMGDLDSDGFMDVVSAVWSGQNELFLNSGTAVFSDYSDGMPPDNDKTRCVRIGDFDGDGRPDVFFTTDQVNRIYLNLTP